MGNLGGIKRTISLVLLHQSLFSQSYYLLYVMSLTSVHLCFVAGFQPLLLEPLLKFHHTLRKLGLQEEEYVLMQAMSLFSPGSRKSSSVHPSPC